MVNFDRFISKNKKKILISVIIISLLITLFLDFNVIKTQTTQDSFWYMSLAKNLAEGNGYTLDGINPHGQYPPLFPLLVSFFYIFLGNVQLAGLILVGILSVCTLFMAYKIGEFHSDSIAVLFVFLMAFNNLFVFNSVSLMTEIPFMFLSLLGIYLFIKGFENNKYFLFAFPILALTVLIRYSGAVLIFPIVFYSYFNKDKLKKIIFSDKFILGVSIGCFFFFLLFLRNLITFGTPLYTSYTNIKDISLSNFLTFTKMFFHLGFILPIISLFGMFFSIKSKNRKIQFFLVLFLVYFLLHASWWGGGIFRFYSGILPTISLFAAIGIIDLAKEINSKGKSKMLISAILIIFIVSQSFIFFYDPFGHKMGMDKLNKYGPLQKNSEYALSNLPLNSNYLVSDIAVYSIYLPRENLFYYNEGLNLLLQNKISIENTYIFAETHHNWMTKPFLAGENGTIILPLDSGQNLVLKTEILKKEEHEDHYAILLNITDAGFTS